MTDGPRERIAAAFRAAAHDCPGNCGQTERECTDAHPIQVEVLHFDQVAVISGPVEALADVALAAVAPELERAEKAEAQLAIVRQYCELTADSCHVPTRQTAIDILQLLDDPKAETT